MKTLKRELASIGFVYFLALGLVCAVFLAAALPELITSVSPGEVLSNAGSGYYLQ